MVMWLLNVYKSIQVRRSPTNLPSVLYYSNSLVFIISAWGYKRRHKFIYVNTRVFSGINMLTMETRNVRFKYLGKAYRISKKKNTRAHIALPDV
jgi:hypothetical protein